MNNSSFQIALADSLDNDIRDEYRQNITDIYLRDYNPNATKLVRINSMRLGDIYVDQWNRSPR